MEGEGVRGVGSIVVQEGVDKSCFWNRSEDLRGDRECGATWVVVQGDRDGHRI